MKGVSFAQMTSVQRAFPTENRQPMLSGGDAFDPKSSFTQRVSSAIGTRKSKLALFAGGAAVALGTSFLQIRGMLGMDKLVKNNVISMFQSFAAGLTKKTIFHHIENNSFENFLSVDKVNSQYGLADGIDDKIKSINFREGNILEKVEKWIKGNPYEKVQQYVRGFKVDQKILHSWSPKKSYKYIVHFPLALIPDDDEIQDDQYDLDMNYKQLMEATNTKSSGFSGKSKTLKSAMSISNNDRAAALTRWLQEQAIISVKQFIRDQRNTNRVFRACHSAVGIANGAVNGIANGAGGIANVARTASTYLLGQTGTKPIQEDTIEFDQEHQEIEQ